MKWKKIRGKDCEVNKPNEKEKINTNDEINMTEKEIAETKDEEEIENYYIQSEENDLKKKDLQNEVLGGEKEAAFTMEYIDNKEDEVQTEDSNIEEYSIKVRVNNEEITLKGKEKYIFVDIFNHVEFDLSVAKGKLVLLLNGKIAGYYDNLQDGDSIEIRWE